MSITIDSLSFILLHTRRNRRNMKPIRQPLLILGQVKERERARGGGRASEKRGREEKTARVDSARAHLFASFHSSICVGSLPMYYVSLSLFLSGALVCTQLIHGRMRSRFFFFSSFSFSTNGDDDDGDDDGCIGRVGW